jgi:transcriptional regulator with XRE-family HTH domain
LKISELIREERLKRNLTLVQLAELLGCTHAVISTWELGKAEPGPKYLRKLKDVLGISLYTTTNENTRYVAEDPPKYETPTKDDSINKLITSNQMLAESSKLLAESNKLQSENSKMLAESQKMLAEANIKLASLVDTVNNLTEANKKYQEKYEK